MSEEQSLMSHHEAISAGVQHAKETRAGPWVAFGLFVPLVAIFIVYLRPLSVPARLMENDLDPIMWQFFERAYLSKLRERQVRAVWLGVVASFLLTIIGVVAFVLSMQITDVVKTP